MFSRLTRTLLILLLVGIVTILLAPALIGRWDVVQLRNPHLKASIIHTHWWSTTATIPLSLRPPVPFKQLIGTPKQPIIMHAIIHHGPFISFDFNQAHHWQFAKNLIELHASSHWQSPILLIQHWNGTVAGLINIQQLHWRNTHSITSVARLNGQLTWIPHQSLLTQLTLHDLTRRYHNQLTLQIDQDNYQSTQHIRYHRWHGISEHHISALTFIRNHQPMLHTKQLRTINETIHQQTQVHHRFFLQATQLQFAGQQIDQASLSAALTTPSFQTLDATHHCLLQKFKGLSSPLTLGTKWRPIITDCLNNRARLRASTRILLTPDRTLNAALMLNQGNGSLTLHVPRDWLLEELTDYYEAQIATTSLSASEHQAKQKINSLLLDSHWHQPSTNHLTFQADF